MAAKKKTTKADSFPKTVYAVTFAGTDEICLSKAVLEDLIWGAALDGGESIGVYELVAIKKLKLGGASLV